MAQKQPRELQTFVENKFTTYFNFIIDYENMKFAFFSLS